MLHIRDFFSGKFALSNAGKPNRDKAREIDICFGAQPAPAPHPAHPDVCAALRIVLLTVPRVSRSCEQFPDGFDIHLLQGYLAHKKQRPSRSL